MSRRALKNVALAYLASPEDQEFTDLALQEYKTATNMTEHFTALASIAQNPVKTRDDVLADFYEKWQNDYLVVNKWFALQAVSDIPGNVENVRKLLSHPAFDLHNPNKVYSLIGGFCGLPVNFHAKDGSGYEFLGDIVLFDRFGNSKPSSHQRPTLDIGSSSKSTFSASETASNTTKDPFKIFESTSAPTGSSSRHFTDPLEEISKLTSSRSTKIDFSSNSNDGVYDDTDSFDGLGNSVPAFSSEGTCRNDTSSPMPRSNTSSSWTRDKESFEKLFVRSLDRRTHNKILVEHDKEFHQTPYGMPIYSSDSNKPIVDQRSQKYEEKLVSDDDMWLTVSEIPLSIQPTAAPPPSRPPPPRPVHIPMSETGSPAFANVRKDNGFSSFPSSTRFSQDPKYAPATTKLSSASQFDELEDFAMGTSHSDDDECENGDPDKELEMNSAATAMKEAMEKAESKFRHAKEVWGSENTKPAPTHTLPDSSIIPNAPNFDNSPDSGNDIEEAMIHAAIEASKRKAEENYSNHELGRQVNLSESGPNPRQTFVEDPELAHAISLSLKTTEQEKARRVQKGDIGAHSAGPSKAPAVELGEVSSNGRLQAGSLSYKEEDRYICGLCAAVWFVSSRT
ncbi:unnamed protein product [Vicia faba]|uniref:Peptidase M1 alanyl aminopeptidase C-terminal domain-containing protein n=1 Tax=Vicia faba TaxID=3906 RepID=A0AAV1B236_VICFA|nr:unnamed protein product [Vicia faba]